MDCAIELLAIRAAAIEEKERAEAEYQRRRSVQVLAGTINWCDNNLNEKLRKAAADPTKRSIEVTIPVRMNGDYDEFQLLKRYTSAAGREYWDVNSAWMSVKGLKEYLEKHCFKVSFPYFPYTCCNGGCFRHSANLVVSIDAPDCLGG